MPDILSQEEINALLEAHTPDYPMLNNWLAERLGLEEKDLNLLVQQVIGARTGHVGFWKDDEVVRVTAAPEPILGSGSPLRDIMHVNLV